MAEKPTIPPARGCYLLSEPFLSDPNFRRSVVLLTEHEEETGSIGFVLNRPTGYLIHEILQGFPEMDALVHVGGPVQQDSLHYLHRIPELEGSQEVHKGVYWGGDFDRLRELAESKQIDASQVRFFIGYSGWAPGQLDSEMESKTWIVAKGRAAFTFHEDTDNLWKEILASMGSSFKSLANYPENPSDN
jgi:putative transcriptional regulator